MTPKEMHIAVEQGLQRHSSSVFDDFLPEEIDLVLNKVQNRFINDKFRRDNASEGYEFQQGDLDDIQFLIEKDVELPAFLNFPFDNAYCILPSNYLYLVNDRSRINDNCKVNDFTVTDIYRQENYGVYTLKNSTRTTFPFYDNFTITYNNNIIFNINDYEISDGLSSNEEKFVIKNLVLDVIRQDLPDDIIGIYWERYRDMYHPDSFIIISRSITSNNNISIDSVVTNVTTSLVPNLLVSDLPTTRQVYNRLTKSEDLHSVLNDNVFYRTIPRSPVSSLTKDRLSVYFNQKFIVKSIIIDYIRSPQNISLSLNRSCELDESTHERIVDLAVEFIKNTIEQQSYDTKVRDNLLRSE